MNGDHAPTAVADSGGPAELAEIRARIVHDAEHKVVARTRSAAIVAEIEQEIVEQGWPIGASIGHEAQLMERFDVSRSVLREAIRTLESSGVVTVRTGRGGGLVVAAPHNDTVKMAASLYLDYMGFEPRHVFHAWAVIETALIDLVVERATDDELRELRACLEWDTSRGPAGVERSSFILGLARLSRNPLLELFFQITADVAKLHGHDLTPRTADWFMQQYGLIADAIERRDGEAASDRLRAFLARLADTDSVVERRRPRRT